MSTKSEFAEELQENATLMAQLAERMVSLEATYFDRGYNGGGSDPIIDGDVSSFGITAANVSSWITLAQQFANFRDNSAVTTGDYDSTLNAIRNDI